MEIVLFIQDPANQPPSFSLYFIDDLQSNFKMSSNPNAAGNAGMSACNPVLWVSILEH